MASIGAARWYNAIFSKNNFFFTRYALDFCLFCVIVLVYYLIDTHFFFFY